MPEPLKNLYNPTFFAKFNKSVKNIKTDFNEDQFLKEIFNDKWDNLELKERMRHISITLNDYLYNDYQKNINFLIRLLPVLVKNGFKAHSFEFVLIPDFIYHFGKDNYEVSINAIEEVTQFITCEFAIRPFILNYEKKAMKQMLKWSKHKNHHVRRLASEGCRPRLPWAEALPEFKKDPSPILPILENLKNDDSEYVRRSVANNLNDLAKDNPNIVIDIIKKWIGKTAETDWVCKHASRTLLKAGNQEIMQLFGFGDISKINISEFKVLTPKVNIGGDFLFSFNLKNNANNSTKIRVEYAIYYQKANGTLSKKVYKISERDYEPNEIYEINRKQSFKIITTRTFHPGLHQVSIILNGIELDKLDFELIK